MILLVSLPAGRVALRLTARGIAACGLPRKSERAALNALVVPGSGRRRAVGGRCDQAIILAEEEVPGYWSGARVARLGEQMQHYFAGQRVEFDFPVDLCGLFGFTQEVLTATREIKYGEVRTYGWVARRIGHPRAARAVGQALHRNPAPIIIPCHRVIGSDGSLVGFGAGLAWKRRLLRLEAP